MLKLHARLDQTWDENPFVVRLSSGVSDPEISPFHEGALVSSSGELSPQWPQQFRCSFIRSGDKKEQTRSAVPPVHPMVFLPSCLDHLGAGDVVRVSPRSGEIWIMYRRHSISNSMLLTEQCNSNCMMCSQPPKVGDDRHLVDAYLEAIPLMSPDTQELGITGGEPTLLGERLLEILAACRDRLPQTSLHLLSNGRMFNYISFCRSVAAVGNADLMAGIPLYSDLASQHDFVVQAAGAYDQTIRGMMNLERMGIPVEVRVVLHRQTISRLPQLARFIARNLPFASHVALMGMENMGHVRMNLDALWIDPSDFQHELREAVLLLDRHHITTSIYNYPLCLLDPILWTFARKSISDWKNEYLDICDACAVKSECGGFFVSATVRRSEQIRPIAEKIPLLEDQEASAGKTPHHL